jgi:hypothetical protein
MTACVQCRRSPADLGANRLAEFSQFMTRKPPKPSCAPEYVICFGCAVRVKEEQDERAAEADRQAERSGV